MYKFINDPITKLVIFCVALSAGLWVWSKHLPEPTWESTLAVTPPPKTAETASAPGSENKLPAAIPTPTDTVAASPEPKSVAPEISAPASETPAPAPDIAASAAPAPSTDTASVAPSASAEPAAPLPSPTAAPSDATLAGPLPQNPAPESASTPAPEAASTRIRGAASGKPEVLRGRETGDARLGSEPRLLTPLSRDPGGARTWEPR